MLLAFSVLGGLAVPDNPDSPSYTAGAWHRYFPVQKVSAPKSPIATTVDVYSESLLPGDWAAMRLVDKRWLSQPGVNLYESLFIYRNGVSSLRLSKWRHASSYFVFGFDNMANGVVSVAQTEAIPGIVETVAENGIASARNISAKYGGVSKGETPRTHVYLRSTDMDAVFYYHHASKGDWHCNIIALQSADSHGAVINLATQQFIALT